MQQLCITRFVLAAPPQTAAPLAVFMQIPRMVLYLENVLGLAQPLRTQMRPVGVFLAVSVKSAVWLPMIDTTARMPLCRSSG